jgi:hypothetical protein
MSPQPYRYAFGDETGDPGFAFERGSTRYWAIILLLLDDPEPLRQRIADLHSELNIPAHVKFKFHKTSDGNRLAFLTALRPFPFVGRALAIDKTQLPPKWQGIRDVSFYAGLLAELIMRLPKGELHETIMVLDQFGTPDTVLRELRRRLRIQDDRQLPRPLKKILPKRSRGEALLQCADMVVGALMREIHGGDTRFFDLMRDKVIVWRM